MWALQKKIAITCTAGNFFVVNAERGVNAILILLDREWMLWSIYTVYNMQNGEIAKNVYDGYS